MVIKNAYTGKINLYSDKDISDVYTSSKNRELNEYDFYNLLTKDSKSLENLISSKPKNELKSKIASLNNKYNSKINNLENEDFYTDNQSTTWAYFMPKNNTNLVDKIKDEDLSYSNKLYLKYDLDDMLDKQEDYLEFTEKLYQNLFKENIIHQGKMKKSFIKKANYHTQYSKSKDAMIFYINNKKGYFKEFEKVFKKTMKEMDFNPQLTFSEVGRDFYKKDQNDEEKEIGFSYNEVISKNLSKCYDKDKSIFNFKNKENFSKWLNYRTDEIRTKIWNKSVDFKK